jgi:hypothetical protein
MSMRGQCRVDRAAMRTRETIKLRNEFFDSNFAPISLTDSWEYAEALFNPRIVYYCSCQPESLTP